MDVADARRSESRMRFTLGSGIACRVNRCPGDDSARYRIIRIVFKHIAASTELERTRHLFVGRLPLIWRSMMKNGASVCATYNIIPHLINRQHVVVFGTFNSSALDLHTADYLIDTQSGG
jgi:hypothetical protein